MDTTKNNTTTVVTPAEPPRPPENAEASAAKFADLVDVEILEFPCTDRKGRKYGVETADQLIATSAAFADRVKPPFVLGHNEADAGQITTGMPALGWGGALRKKMVGASVRLVTNLSQVPAAIKDLIDKGAYKRISAAFWPDGAEAGIPEAKGRPVIRHIGLLGADTPRIKTLADVQALYQPATPPAAAFADTAEADVAEFSMDAAPAAEEAPTSLQAAVEAEGDSEAMRPLFSGVQARLWALQEEGRKGKTVAEIIAGLESLGAELTAICAKMREMPGAPPAAAAAEMADGAGATRTAGAGAPGSSAGGQAAAAPVPAAAAPARPWQGEPAVARPQGDAVASPAEPVAAAAGPKPQAASPAPAVQMSDSAKQTVETFITRATAAGKLLPKHHLAIRAQAKAVYFAGGDEALVSFIDDQAALRQAKVIDLSETGKATPGAPVGSAAASAEFADCDPGLVAAAEAEYTASEIGRKFPGVTKAGYVKARISGK
jgi:hypothetical protein